MQGRDGLTRELGSSDLVATHRGDQPDETGNTQALPAAHHCSVITEPEALVGLGGVDGCGLCRGPTDAFVQAHGAHASGVCKVQQALSAGAQLSASKGQ